MFGPDQLLLVAARAGWALAAGAISAAAERVDVVLDGERRVRPAMLLSAPILEEADRGSR
jgi:hypothetical protein